MKKLFSLLLLLGAFNAFGQEVHIDTLVLPTSQSYADLQSGTMHFPLIRTGDGRIDSLINFDLKNKFTHHEYPESPIDSTLIHWGADHLIYLDFEVTYNKAGILGLAISAEGCGAYCTNWTEYFTYSTVTGQPLSLGAIIVTTAAFREKVRAQKSLQYDQQRKELKEMLLDPDSGLDEDTYAWVLEQYNTCDRAFEFQTFALYPDRLVIIENCYLPNILKNLTPTIDLTYSYADIQEYLKIKL